MDTAAPLETLRYRDGCAYRRDRAIRQVFQKV
jgi:hypothetical protein